MSQPQQQTRNLFDFFDDDAKRAVQLARDEVERHKRDAIGPEHLLLALLAIEDSKARELSVAAGVDVDAWRQAIDEVAGTGEVEELPQQLPFTPEGQQTMQILVQIMGSLFHRSIGTEHMLLALLQDQNGVTAKSLEQLGATREAVGGKLSEHLKTLPVDEQMRAQAEAAMAQRQQQAQAAAAAPRAGGRPMSPSAQRVLQAADAQAVELKHAQTGTVHLLLALVSDPDRMAKNVFLRLGVRPEDLRAELLRQLRADDPEAPAATDAPAPAESTS